MKVWSQTFALLLTILLFIQSNSLSIRSSVAEDIPLLTLISMDGFRYDYLDHFDNKEVPNFYYLINNGVKAASVHNVFPSVTLPSHMTLLSGLYPENHGVVHNRFYDAYYNKTYDLFDFLANEDPRFFDNGQETIWVTNQNAGLERNTGSMLFPDAVTTVKGVQPRIIPNSFYANDSITWERRVDTLIDWFQDKYRPINLGLLYFPEPDETGHRNGPEIIKGKELHSVILKLDKILGYFINKLNESNILHKMNIILTADHGMVKWNGQKVNLDDLVNPDLYKTASNGGNHIVELVYPKKGSEDEVFQSLKKSNNIYVYRKNSKEAREIHYSNHHRIPEIVVEAKEGFVIGNTESLKTFHTTGNHGYDPGKVKAVHPFFIASGPVFKKNFKSPTVKQIDIYSLMCHILKVPSAKSDGSMETVADLLSTSLEGAHTKDIETTSVTFLVIVLFTALVSGIFCIGAFRQSRITARKRMILGRPRKFNVASRDIPAASALLESDDDDL
ncbi:hypothetical protein FSP39_020838 [Pinctada imbricata]|uniref:Uncharacterized protein n=1 Tax=Pinctada imbricata TaxID=66713 RepID=A0AA88YB35_PINIB|nr:hypothetical protein FSP39_020838 [Pinctada imbricata]